MTPRSGSGMLSTGKVGGAAGILFIVVFFIAMGVQGSTPMTNDSASTIKDYYVNHAHAYLIGDFLIFFSFVFLFLPFASVLRSRLGRAEGQEVVWSRLVFAGALLLTAIGAATAGMRGSLAYSAAAFTDDNLLKTVTDMDNYSFAVGFPFGAGLLLLSASVVILSTSALWKWLAWLGILVAVVSVVGALSVLNQDPNGLLSTLEFAALAGFGIWIIATSIALWRQEVATS